MYELQVAQKLAVLPVMRPRKSPKPAWLKEGIVVTAAQAKQRRNIKKMLSVELFNGFSYRQSYFATIE